MLIKLESDRLIVRKLKTYDLFDAFEYMSDEDTMKYFTEGPYNKNKVKKMLNPEGEQEHYAIVLKDNLKTIGHLDFHKWEMKDTYEIGWAINKSFSNQGYVTEAAKLLISHVFSKNKVHRIIATCQPQNIASKRICEKLGMRLEGTFIKCIFSKKDDAWWDELFYALLKEEYFENKNNISR
jgi:RimJ/RimL family protein N-acetyltransferase